MMTGSILVQVKRLHNSTDMYDNEDAVILEAQDFISQHGAVKHGGPVQRLMDLVSGISQYKMLVTSPQGYIYNKLVRGRLEYNHIIDQDQMISRFWSGVFKSVMLAKAVGTVVNVDDGTDVSSRATRLTPLQYIRKYGVSAARKYIDECCKKKLRQQCNDCHTVSSLGSQREYDKGCHKCGSFESIKPHQFVRKRVRICVKCGTIRTTRFERVCGRIGADGDGQTVSGGCGSENITIIQIEDLTDQIDTEFDGGHEDTPESNLHEAQAHDELNKFTQACLDSLPSDASGDSSTKRVLRVLIDPACGGGVCRECARVAPKIVVDDEEVPDPKYCCGATKFAIGHCINYSKRLGQYFGYSAALANRRVDKVRQHTLAIAKKYTEQFDVAKAIVARLANRN
jgi:hypothetical protein